MLDSVEVWWWSGYWEGLGHLVGGVVLEGGCWAMVGRGGNKLPGGGEVDSCPETEGRERPKRNRK